MAPAGEVSEDELVRRAQKYDSEAVAELYRLYVARIYRYCLARVANVVAAEDITEEVFLNMVEALPHYVDRGVPFAAWLYRVAHDRVVDFHRREARRPTDELTEDMQDSSPAPEEQAARRADIRNLLQATSQLSDDYQMVLQLRFVEGHSLEETARLMRKTVGATKILQHRALHRLSRLFKK